MGGANVLYYWLLVAIFIEYARPGSHIPALSIPFLYSAVPLLLFLVSMFVPGLRPVKEIFSDSISKWIFIYVSLVALSIAIAPVKRDAIAAFEMVLGYSILFLLIARIATTVRRLHGVIFSLLAAHLFLLAFNPDVVLDPTERHYVVGATFLGDGNDFALSACILLPLTIAIAQSREASWAKTVVWAGVGLVVLAIIGTQSRGGTLGMAAVLFFLLLRSSRKGLIFGAVTLTLAAVLAFAPSQYFQRMGTIASHQDGSAQGRIQAWKAGLGMGLKNPVLGVGARQFGWRWGKTAHSSYILALAELGIPGITCVLVLVFGNLRANARLKRSLRPGSEAPSNQGDEVLLIMLSATSGAMIAFAVAGAFLSAAYYPHLFVVTALMVSVRSMAAQWACSHGIETRHPGGVPARRLRRASRTTTRPARKTSC